MVGGDALGAQDAFGHRVRGLPPHFAPSDRDLLH